MTRVCIVMDGNGLPGLGGAELTMQQHIDGKPANVEIVYGLPDAIPVDVDAYVVSNCIEFSRHDISALRQHPVIKKVHDVWPRGDRKLKTWLCENAKLMIYNSPLHFETRAYRVTAPVVYIPPQVNWQACEQAAQTGTRDREACWVGRFDTGKGVLETIRWARENNLTLDWYGYGHHHRAVQATGRFHGLLVPEQVPAVMAQYRQFVLMPLSGNFIEPFGRTVAEAWFAGCEIVTNGNCGAVWWIENQPEALKNANQLFWDAVLEAIA